MQRAFFWIGTLLFAAQLAACASSNPTRRCGRDPDCLDDDVCYRGFCIAPYSRDAGPATGDASRTCPFGQTACDDRCVDLLRDRNHCGRCDAACDGPRAMCVLGRCTSN